MVNIYSDLNKSYALDDMVCIKDIRTERDKKRAEEGGFPVGFTRSSWREQFPSIPAKYVFCRKSVGVFGPSSLIYYDKAHYICFDLQIYNGQCLDIVHALNTGKEVPSIEEQIQKQVDKMMKLYEAKEAEFPEPEAIRELERVILLKVIDRKWMDHIDDMEQLRQGVGLQAYGQRDPLVEYKLSGYEMFDEMTQNIKEETVRVLFHVRVEQKVEREEVAKVTGTNKDDSAVKAPVRRENAKIYPNDPCPCGSGKKYKQCCGRKA